MSLAWWMSPNNRAGRQWTQQYILKHISQFIAIRSIECRFRSHTSTVADHRSPCGSIWIVLTSNAHPAAGWAKWRMKSTQRSIEQESESVRIAWAYVGDVESQSFPEFILLDAVAASRAWMVACWFFIELYINRNVVRQLLVVRVGSMVGGNILVGFFSHLTQPNYEMRMCQLMKKLKFLKYQELMNTFVAKLIELNSDQIHNRKMKTIRDHCPSIEVWNRIH